MSHYLVGGFSERDSEMIGSISQFVTTIKNAALGQKTGDLTQVEAHAKEKAQAESVKDRVEIGARDLNETQAQDTAVKAGQTLSTETAATLGFDPAKV